MPKEVKKKKNPDRGRGRIYGSMFKETESSEKKGKKNEATFSSD